MFERGIADKRARAYRPAYACELFDFLCAALSVAVRPHTHAMARFKLCLRDQRRKLADLEVEVNAEGVKIEDARSKALLGCATEQREHLPREAAARGSQCGPGQAAGCAAR